MPPTLKMVTAFFPGLPPPVTVSGFDLVKAADSRTPRPWNHACFFFSISKIMILKLVSEPYFQCPTLKRLRTKGRDLLYT